MALISNHDRCPVLRRWSVLVGLPALVCDYRLTVSQVRVDWFHRSDPLGCTSSFRYLYWLWCTLHLPAMLQLSSRFIPIRVSTHSDIIIRTNWLTNQ